MARGRRTDGRTCDELRKVVMISPVNPYAEGSCEVSFGRTKVLCTATIEHEVPRWMERGKETGWITAEYGMLPRATHTRSRREASQGKQGGRTLEIQRLIGRALRQAVDLNELTGITVRIDCDVLCADGGTRTASICGGWVALAHALQRAAKTGVLPKRPKISKIGAISVGKVDGRICLDLNYDEDSKAAFDLNIVLDQNGGIIEIQGTGEHGTISEKELSALLAVAKKGIAKISRHQGKAIA